MKKEHPKVSGFDNPRRPWCETCRAYRKISVKGGKKTCASCGQASIFVPALSQAGSLGCVGLCGIFLLATFAWQGFFILPAIFFGLGSLGAHVRYKKWVKWTEEDAARRKRQKRKEKRKKKREEALAAAEEDALAAEAGNTLPSSPPPVPPPLPPDADDED